jgi:hypothetical protein
LRSTSVTGLGLLASSFSSGRVSSASAESVRLSVIASCSLRRVNEDGRASFRRRWPEEQERTGAKSWQPRPEAAVEPIRTEFVVQIVVASRKQGSASPEGEQRPRRSGRGEAARRALSDGIDRSRRLVERYRTFLIQLHDPSVMTARKRAAGLRPSGGSSG